MEQKIEIEVKKRLCNECGTYTRLKDDEDIDDDTYCKNCGKWLN